MIVIGSHALATLGLRAANDVKDLDLVGTREEMQQFRARHQGIIEGEREEHGHRQVFQLKSGLPWERVEIDYEQSASDKMLPSLCDKTCEVLGLAVQVPPLEVLYLIKRAHANVPVHYDKTIRDIIRLKPHLGTIGDDEQAFYLLRKQECQSRYALQRQRFSLSVRNEDFFDLSDHVRAYVHDDLHEAVAHEPDQPLYKRCKHDLTLAKIDIDLFESLSAEDQLRMVQEEFMVIGLERFYLHDNSLPLDEIYLRGMHKTIRDLFVGYFQDFCIDHIDQLLKPPAYNFVNRFESALRDGRIRTVDIPIPPTSNEHKQIWQLIQNNELNEARRRSEDMVRRADAPGDTHAFFLLGVVLMKSQKFGPSEKCFRRCVSRDRKNRLAWYHLGVLCMQTGRNAEAIDHLLRAEALGLKKFNLYWHLGLACESVGKSHEAINAYTEGRKYKQEAPLLERRLAALSKAGLSEEH